MITSDSYHGFLYHLDEPARAERVLDRLGVPDAGYSDAISAADWEVAAAELFLVAAARPGDDVALHGAALVRRGKRVATQKVRVDFRAFVAFTPPIPVADLEDALDQRLLAHFLRATSGHGRRVPQRTWAAVLDAIRRMQPDAADGLAALEAQRTFSGARFGARPGGDVVALERDATNVVLRVGDVGPAPLLTWRPPKDGGPVTPFLAGLARPQAASVYEDRMIERDARVFGGWERLWGDVRGVARFGRPGREHLTVFNVNRTPVERTLGVDLVYYVERYGACLLVQYKRMEREGGPAGDQLGYRPLGRSYRAEFARMRAASLAFAEPADAVGGGMPLPAYRLHAGACFFKLCPAEVIDPTSTDMLRGMYLPLDYWERLVDSPAVAGPRGGIRVTFENAGRYFNNTLFVQLAQDGWVGSRVQHARAITDYVWAALDGDHSVTLAVDTRRRDGSVAPPGMRADDL